MRLAKCLLVALALWMPAAAFAVGAFDAPCAESSAPDEADRQSEQDEMFLPSLTEPIVSATQTAFDHDGQSPLDGHIAELHSPPPNPPARP